MRGSVTGAEMRGVKMLGNKVTFEDQQNGSAGSDLTSLLLSCFITFYFKSNVFNYAF